MTQYSSGTYTLSGFPGQVVTATVDADSLVTFNLELGFPGSAFEILSAAGSTVIVNNEATGSTIVLGTEGGVIELGALATPLGALDLEIENGGEVLISQADLSGVGDANVSFGSDGGTLGLGSSGTPADIDASPLEPFLGFNAPSDVVDDLSLSFTADASYTITGASVDQTITVTSGGNSLEFQTDGAGLATGSFSAGGAGPLLVTADGSGGLDVSVCYLEGTHIATPEGERLIESLAIGDRVLTADGGIAPVKWLGWLTVCTAFADPLRALPVRIRAGALGENTPARDLLVSPRHAMFLDGVLVQAAALLNGTTVVRETRMPGSFRYFHIELADHALILAEGAASETFVDNADRMASTTGRSTSGCSATRPKWWSWTCPAPNLPARYRRQCAPGWRRALRPSSRSSWPPDTPVPGSRLVVIGHLRPAGKLNTTWPVIVVDHRPP